MIIWPERLSGLAQGQANYERAFPACMAGRGYIVR